MASHYPELLLSLQIQEPTPPLKENGISRRSFADILSALEAASDAEPQHGVQYLASHPPTRERNARFSE